MTYNEVLTYLKKYRYPRGKQWQTSHLLTPMFIDSFEFSLPSDTSKYVQDLFWCLICSINPNDDSFDMDRFKSNMSDKLKDEDKGKIDVSIENSILNYVIFLVTDNSNNFLAFNKNTTSYGLQRSMTTLLRLKSTFQSVSVLLRYAHFMEVRYLYRVILEQIAYAFKCYNMESKEEIDKLISSKCINKLKEIDSECGKLYGIFSHDIHHNSNMWDNFLDVDIETGFEYVKTQSGIGSKECIVFLISIAKIYLSVTREVYHEYDEEKERFDIEMEKKLTILEIIKNHYQ